MQYFCGQTISFMKIVVTTLISLLLLACKKNSNTDAASDVVPAKLKTTWKLKSETRAGAVNERYVPPAWANTITFGNDGKANCNFEGQSGLVYNYPIAGSFASINYKFVLYLPPYTATNIQKAFILEIGDSLLVLQNSFTATVNGTTSTLSLTDTLIR
jgi:hypothetical protein